MPEQLPPGPRLPGALQTVGIWTRPLSWFSRLRRHYGKRFTLRLPLVPPFVILSDPSEIKEVFLADPDALHPGEGARVLRPLLGDNSVILLDGDLHMEQRKLLLPPFHGERIKALEELVRDAVERELERLERGEQRLHQRMQALTLEVILRAVFGLDPGPRLDELRELLTALLSFADRPASIVPIPEPGERTKRLLNTAGPFKGFFGLRERVDELLFALVEERRRQREGRADVLALLLDARHEDGSPMSDAELRDELMTLLVAGHETTATALAWAFVLLARHPRVAGELADSLEDGDEYLIATIQEVLRRRPVLPNAAPRLSKVPYEVAGRPYPSGICLVPNAYLVHHDPELYPDPYAFRPERFLGRKPGTYEWLPFGGGRRRCLGASFAQLEMRVVLRAIFGAYEMSADGPLEPARRRNITIRPANGALVRLSARDRARARRTRSAQPA